MGYQELKPVEVEECKTVVKFVPSETPDQGKDVTEFVTTDEAAIYGTNVAFDAEGNPYLLSTNQTSLPAVIIPAPAPQSQVPLMDALPYFMIGVVVLFGLRLTRKKVWTSQ